MPLAEAQAALRDAIIDGRGASVMPMLWGGRDPTYRLSIHQRHYEQSLVDLLRRRFPALEWLLGEQFLSAAAREYAHHKPPRRPALGAYGEDFPAFLAGRPRAESMPWLAEVGALEWRLGEVAAAVDATPLQLDAMGAVEDIPLEALHLRFQRGMAYLALDWPVDELVKLHLQGTAPERLEFAAERVFLELRGARGAFAMRRLDPATFAFRATIADDTPLAAAITAAEATGLPFDAGAALAAAFAEGAVTDVFVAEGGAG